MLQTNLLDTIILPKFKLVADEFNEFVELFNKVIIRSFESDSFDNTKK